MPTRQGCRRFLQVDRPLTTEYGSPGDHRDGIYSPVVRAVLSDECPSSYYGHDGSNAGGKGKGNVDRFVYRLYIKISKAVSICSTHCRGISQLYLHTLRFILKRNESCLPLPSQPQLVLVM